jgi:hypothetical protein
MKGKRCARVPLRLLVTFLLFGSVGSFILGQELGHNFSIFPVYAAQSFMFSGAGITAALSTPIQATGALGSPTPTTSTKTRTQIKPPAKPPVNRAPAKPTATAPAPTTIAPGPAAPPTRRCATTLRGPDVNPVSPVPQPPAGTGKSSNGAPPPVSPDGSTGPKNTPGSNGPDGISHAAPASAGNGAPAILLSPASGLAPAGLVSGVSPSLPSERAGVASTTPCLEPKPAKHAVGSNLTSTPSSQTTGAMNQPAQLLVAPQSPAPVTQGAPDATAVQAQAGPIQTPTEQSTAPVTSAESDAPDGANAQGAQSSATAAPLDNDPAQVAPLAP